MRNASDTIRITDLLYIRKSHFHSTSLALGDTKWMA